MNCSIQWVMIGIRSLVKLRLHLIILPFLVFAAPAHAYVGPGAGIGILGTLAALAGAVILLLAGFIWYPVKRMMKKKRGHAGAVNDEKSDV